eukprot:TRINITY_DN337_c0_g1_i1.p1 TRINITY_DN337_c0_g1~~TRINITY_DN337_c0_g1_i1.p1  ORF type:complete len:367 (-),score=61.89 TRINITY_DN337_c0_g1_i1:72-1007(-)
MTGERIAVFVLAPETPLSTVGDMIAVAAERSRRAAFPIRPKMLWNDVVLDVGQTLEEAGLYDGAQIDAEMYPAIVTASTDRTARVWNAESGECEKTLVGHTDAVFSACFGPDGKYIATASEDKTARIWSSVSGKCWRELVGHKDSVYTVEFSPDNRLLVSASADNTARVWNVKNGTCVHVLHGHEAALSNAMFLPDCQTVVTASRDFTIKEWNSRTGICDRTSMKGQDPIYSTGFSPEGELAVIAKGGADATIVEVKTGKVVVVLEDHTGVVHSARYAPAPRPIITAASPRGKMRATGIAPKLQDALIRAA